jgi:hypothetical protein
MTGFMIFNFHQILLAGWVRHIASIGKMRNTYGILIGKRWR